MKRKEADDLTHPWRSDGSYDEGCGRKRERKRKNGNDLCRPITPNSLMSTFYILCIFGKYLFCEAVFLRQNGDGFVGRDGPESHQTKGRPSFIER